MLFYIKVALERFIEVYNPSDKVRRAKFFKVVRRGAVAYVAFRLYLEYRERKTLMQVAKEECKQLLGDQILYEKRYW